MTAAIKELPVTTEYQRHRHNMRLIMAARGVVTLKVGAEIKATFDSYKKENDVLALLSSNSAATAWLAGEPLDGFLLQSDLKHLSAVAPIEIPKKIVASAEVNAAAPEIVTQVVAVKQPAVPMKRQHTVPRLPKAAVSIFDYIGENGAIKWPDLKKGWNGLFEPKTTCANARVAILALEVECGFDVFHDRLLVGGNAIEQWAGELSDHATQMLRVMIQKTFQFDPGPQNTHDAAVQLCLQNRFDPVLDYLDGLTWDGKPRLDKWFVQYLGAEDTELNRVVSRLSLVAAVRRARQPGCKFDQIIVLEGQEGTQKSTAIATMAGDENFSDQTILGLDDRAQMERLKGKWIYEIADLAGMKRSEVEVVKAFASRTADRARPAYGRHVVEQPRRCVLFATTNDDAYLKSQTGNRRFWPVKTGRINLEALRRDRDQLWAEAAKVEATRESISLPERMWAKARVEQDKRLEHDPWDDILDAAKGEIYKAPDADEERIASCDLLLDYLKIPAERATKEAERKLAQCMRRLGWDGPKKMRIGGKPQRGYHRFTTIPENAQASEEESVPPWRR